MKNVLIFILVAISIVACGNNQAKLDIVNSDRDSLDSFIKEGNIKVVYQLGKAVLVFDISDVKEYTNNEMSIEPDEWELVVKKILDTTTSPLYIYEDSVYTTKLIETTKVVVNGPEPGLVDTIIETPDLTDFRNGLKSAVHWSAIKLLQEGKGRVYNRLSKRFDDGIIIQDEIRNSTKLKLFKFSNGKVFWEEITGYE